MHESFSPNSREAAAMEDFVKMLMRKYAEGIELSVSDAS